MGVPTCVIDRSLRPTPGSQRCRQPVWTSVSGNHLWETSMCVKIERVSGRQYQKRVSLTDVHPGTPGLSNSSQDSGDLSRLVPPGTRSPTQTWVARSVRRRCLVGESSTLTRGPNKSDLLFGRVQSPSNHRIPSGLDTQIPVGRLPPFWTSKPRTC